MCQWSAATVLHKGKYYCDECFNKVDDFHVPASVEVVFTLDDLEKTTRFSIYKEINEERNRQDEQWGGPAHDDTHIPNEWLGFIQDQNKKAISDIVKAPMWMWYGSIRARLVKIAALAVAGIESIDREMARKKGQP